MKVLMLLTGSGPLTIMTSYGSATDPGLLEKLKTKGVEKFIAYEIPENLARERYGNHFSVVEHDIHESDDLRVLDYDGQHAYKLFRFDEMSQPVIQEPAS